MGRSQEKGADSAKLRLIPLYIGIGSVVGKFRICPPSGAESFAYFRKERSFLPVCRDFGTPAEISAGYAEISAYLADGSVRYAAGMNPPEDTEVVLEWAATHAREASCSGTRPSRIIRELRESFAERLGYWNSVLFVITARRAFGLTIAECKGAEDFWRGGQMDEEGLDSYLIPLMEKNRPDWNR